MGINKILITLGMIAIFCIALLNFGTQFGIEEGASININQDSYAQNASASIVMNSAQFNIEGNDTNNAMQSSVVDISDTTGTFSTIKVFLSSLASPFVILIDMFKLIIHSLFGTNEFGIVFGIIGTILVLILGFAVIKLWKGGNPD